MGNAGPGGPEKHQTQSVSTQKVLPKKVYDKREALAILELPDLIPNLVAEDLATRWVSFLFFIFLAGALIFTWIAIDHFSLIQRSWKDRVAHQSIQNFTKLLQTVENQQPLDSVGNMISIGPFFIHILPPDKEDPGIYTRGLRLAELEIVLLCDSPNTRDFIESMDVPVRDQITRVLLPSDREKLLSAPERTLLKKAIAEVLNNWLPHGQVKEVYFSKLVLD